MESIPDNSPILVVDDDEGLLLSIKATLLSSDMPEPALLSDGRDAMAMVRKHSFNLVLLDQMMPHITGLEILQQIKEESPHIECIMVTAVDEVSTAVEAMRFGAYDYLVKPLNSEKLKIVISRALERYNLKQELALFEKKQSFSNLKNPDAFKKIIAKDESMARIFHQMEVVAPTDYNVMVVGESGTGKEMISGVIHHLSRRSNSPFLTVNMAAFNRTLFEDDFFGHKKGAFTDAFDDKEGFFEKADGGTIFLDEIMELELPLQGKLLRVIEEKELYRLGSTTRRNVDVRILAATNRDIDEEINNGNFRKDLFYRLNTFNIKIPPLRERKNDILPLASYFTRKHSKLTGKDIRSIGSDMSDFLLNYQFSGNVRELENIIASAVLLETATELSLSSVSSYNMPKTLSGEGNPGEDHLLSLDELEKQHIAQILKITDGNRNLTANILGVNTTTVYRKIKKYGLE
jgi:DNA-binding NtrC family response regulator